MHVHTLATSSKGDVACPCVTVSLTRSSTLATRALGRAANCDPDTCSGSEQSGECAHCTGSKMGSRTNWVIITFGRYCVIYQTFEKLVTPE